MNKKELVEISDTMFRNINHYVIHHGFKLEVYNISSDYEKLILIDDEAIEIMNNFITYMYKKIITQIIIRSKDKTIKVFVKERE